jgi:signal recognition particle subunit SRP54
MLGMGDVLSLIEKAEAALDEGEAEKLEEKLRKNQFTLDDFRSQLKTIKRMGPLESVLGMIPGMGQIKELAQNKPDEKQLARVEAIISSMTAAERANDSIINGSRRKRIAAGSGTSVEDVNRLLKQFNEMRRVIKMIGQGGIGAARHMKNLPKLAPGTQGFSPAGTGKKRKKGGPWGLIKSR